MPFHRGSFRLSFQRLLEQCDLPYMRWHDLRHTFATVLSENEVNIKALALVMGHRDPTITKDVYINPKTEVIDCSAQINRILRVQAFKISYWSCQIIILFLEIYRYFAKRSKN